MRKNRVGLISGTNRNCPIWELGGQFFWRSENPLELCTPVGPGVVTHTEVGGSTDDFVYWETSNARYYKCTVAAAKFPRSGLVVTNTANYRYYAMNGTRGFSTFGTNVATDTPDIGTDHIVDATSFGISTRYKITNGDGSNWRDATKSNAMSATYARSHGMLVRRVDEGNEGGVLSADNVLIYIGDTNGGTQGAGATTYMKVRDDGWYLIWATHAAYSGDRHMGLRLAPGVAVQVELPTLETASTYTFPRMGPPPPAGSSRASNDHLLTFTRPFSGATAREKIPAEGWIAATVRIPFSAGWFTLPYGVIFSWEADTSNFLQFTMSSSSHDVAVDMDSGGAGQVFITRAVTVASLDSVGMVFSWGVRDGAQLAHFCVNGDIVNTDTTFTMPAGAPDKFRIGHEATSSNKAQVAIQRLAAGHAYLNRSQGRILSQWFYRQALPAIY